MDAFVYFGRSGNIMEAVRFHTNVYYNQVKAALSTLIKDLHPRAPFLIPLGIYLSVYCLVCYVIYKTTAIYRNQFSKSEYFETKAKNVLVVTAHPDDECMFFGPVILRVAQKKECNIYLMCLSNGDAENKGHLRKQELFDSCKVLGIPVENVFLNCSSLRLDGHDQNWKSEEIATLVHDYVETYEIDTIITFDKYGVSGHGNHKSVFRAMSFMNLRNWLPPNCTIFILDSVNLLRKYSGVLDCAVSLFLSDHVFILSPFEYKLVKSAMQKHWTQLTWYRRLYFHFSRYPFMNTLTELPHYQDYST